jgi:predicted Zn-dependent protease
VTVEPLDVDWFDGRHARPRRVRLHIERDRIQVLEPENGRTEGRAQGRPGRRAVLLELPLAAIDWPERTRHGARVARIAGGGELHAVDVGLWDAWAASHGLRQPLLVRVQLRWRFVLAILLLLALLAYGAWRWGIPMAGRAAVTLLPQTVDRQLGDAAYAALRQRWLADSALPAARIEPLRRALESLLARAEVPGSEPLQLHFHATRLGPNAFALPGGHVVITDELVTLLDGDETVLLGVLAHEAGHVHGRHGMRLLAQTALLGVGASALAGDPAGWLATLPALLGGAGYSRDLEREADEASIRALRAAGRDPAAMLRLFERLAERRAAGGTEASGGAAIGIAFASHPDDAERIARFRAAAAGPR